MKTKYFANVKTIDEAKKVYTQWAKELHPDKFQDPGEAKDASDKFVAMKAEFEALLAKLSKPEDPKKSVARMEKKIRKTMTIKLTKAEKEKIAKKGSEFAGAVIEGVTHGFLHSFLEKIPNR